MQGEDGKAEWEEEAAHMADIYENAFITISALSCSDPCQYLFRGEIWRSRSIHLLIPEGGSSPGVLARRRNPRSLHSYDKLFAGELDPLKQ